jgi:hypothetical protein
LESGMELVEEVEVRKDDTVVIEPLELVGA